VPQAAATGSDAIPSKVYRIMACGRPVLAVTDDRSDLAALVRSAGCGEIVAPGDAAALAATVDRASRDRHAWSAMGMRGREHVVRHYTRAIVSGQYDALIRLVAGARTARGR
jgi:colanic acid biosynthesis glycosyl transferase WcaI